MALILLYVYINGVVLRQDALYGMYFKAERESPPVDELHETSQILHNEVDNVHTTFDQVIHLDFFTKTEMESSTS